MTPICNSHLAQRNLTPFGTKMFEAEPYNHMFVNML